MCARAASSDFLHNFRFYVQVTGFGQSGSGPQLHTGITGTTITSGFNSCSAPEVTEEAVEYREGHFVYTQKYVGLPTVSDITLGRGVTLTDGSLWTWIRDVIEAGNEYRADVNIYHIHRSAKPQTASGPGTMPFNSSDPSLIVYKCTNAFPTSYKVSGDLDATSSDVSIQELTMAVESVDVRRPSNGDPI